MSEHIWSPAASKKSGTGKSSDVTCSTTEADKDGKKQMVIDAGQKVIGAVNCNTCDFVYTAGEHNQTALEQFWSQPVIAKNRAEVRILD